MAKWNTQIWAHISLPDGTFKEGRRFTALYTTYEGKTLFVVGIIQSYFQNDTGQITYGFEIGGGNLHLNR